MQGVNKVILVGTLGRDPEVKFTQSGKAVCNLSLATSESWTDHDGKRQERTEWHRVVLWGKQAETAGRYLAKGRQVYIEGRIQSREFEAKDGGKRTSFEIVADRMTFIGSKPDGGGRRDDRGEDGWGGEDSLPF